ncbi:Nitroreductase-like protein [Aspergillus keveii]|uniref:Nitroreductase-like protein n=1 Tax=Aspergillus keveii TaxID=714993 RepID=A0ABR4FS72_9EURO
MSQFKSLIDLAKSRRSIYKLGKNSPVPDSTIEEIIETAILHTPSSFNTQSTRLVLLLHNEHERLWDITIQTLGALVATGAITEDMWRKSTLPKLQSLKAAYGTILFYEDPAHIEPYSAKFTIYKEQFQPWAEHTNAMHQYFVWMALGELGFGANLQHYNPLIDGSIAETWGIPKGWRHIAQMVFGSPEVIPSEKTQKPVEERVRVFGKK